MARIPHANVISSAVRYVSVAGFSRLSEVDNEELSAGVQRAVPLLFTGLVPIAVLTAALASPLVKTLYGGEWAPDAEQWEMDSAQAVDEIDPSTLSRDAYCWAWADEANGVVRTRGFFPEEGIEEDEATGSAALALCVALDRPLEVRQGRGSFILARPLGDGRAEVGGEVVLDEVRELG